MNNAKSKAIIELRAQLNIVFLTYTAKLSLESVFVREPLPRRLYSLGATTLLRKVPVSSTDVVVAVMFSIIFSLRRDRRYISFTSYNLRANP